MLRTEPFVNLPELIRCQALEKGDHTHLLNPDIEGAGVLLNGERFKRCGSPSVHVFWILGSGGGWTVHQHTAIMRLEELSMRLCAHRNSVYRSEEHTSELQSRGQIVCRLLLKKKRKKI